MLWKISLLTIAAVLALGPAAAAAPAPAPAKAAAAPKAPAPPAPAAKAAEAEFDARDPASLAALLSSAGAKTQVVRREDGTTMVTVASTAATFSAQYAGCSPQGCCFEAVVRENVDHQEVARFRQ